MLPGGELELLLTAALTSLAILGGAMAVQSGFNAAVGVLRAETAAALADQVNRGLGTGFVLGAPFALVTFVLVLTGAVDL